MTAIGVDIGGTKLAIGVVDDAGQLRAHRQMPLPTYDYDELISEIALVVDRARTQHPDVSSIGVAVASWLSPTRDLVLQAVNLGWDTEPLRADLGRATGLPTVVDNDASCAAWAEYLAQQTDASCGPDEAFAMLTLGTDVGGGVVVAGQLLTGTHGIAGELGHLNVGMGDAPCVCGSTGCLAAYASGRAMMAEARAQMTQTPQRALHLLRQTGGDPELLDGAKLAAAVRAGDQAALSVVRRAARAIAAASAQISRVIDHKVLVLGGGASDLGAVLVDAVDTELRLTHAVGPVQPLPEVRIASTGNRAGVIGAARLADHRLASREPEITHTKEQHPCLTRPT